MSYRLYHTDAFICHQADVGEASRYLYVLTETLGFVIARAQGVRKLPSKLRGHVALYHYSQLTLVRGREYWRLIGAEVNQTIQELKPRSRVVGGRLLSLVCRLAPPGEVNQPLFSLMRQVWQLMIGDRNFLSTDLSLFELYTVSKLLATLGYVSLPVIFAEETFVWSPARAAEVARERTVLLRAVNSALAHSHL